MQTVLAKKALKQFRIIFGAVRHHFREIESTCGISGSQLWLLHEIATHPELGVSRLAENLSIHQSTCSLLVEKLVKKRLIEKQRLSEDQRKVGLLVTAAGQAVLAKAPQPVDGIFPQILASMDAHALQNLSTALELVIARLDDQTSQLGDQHMADL
ncbi:DNA-binding transcriptional regulator, MarR family [Methylophilus rhizosphaerae]|uniref:DNA-binding transcriptional regulator, MarR family n=1 Tax=Methylophilus rhizosphaerae TaxID=492660 RepID=A0A1G9EZ93_9PROT|nr:MarR family transcriptional regulator [Methylophilus rhizosphaerae]SDK81315.1 DNA-binding transcriptional regulator, MarR family [Methylophilus rhizosphaerae]